MEISNGNPIKILYADDDAEDREFFQDALKEVLTNARVTTVNDGDKLMQCIGKLDGQYPDIIFIDINMPYKSGKHCLKEIRSIEKLDTVPVIMFSTSSHPKDIEETFANGANLYVSKPVFFDDEVKIFKAIFSFDWQEQLLKLDKKNFVLYTQPQ